MSLLSLLSRYSRHKKRRLMTSFFKCGRSSKIRTCDLTSPRRTRYQAALYPECKQGIQLLAGCILMIYLFNAIKNQQNHVIYLLRVLIVQIMAVLSLLDSHLAVLFDKIDAINH